MSVPADGVELKGTLAVPDGPTGLVVFAHGSGSSRESPRNAFLAEAVRERDLGTRDGRAPSRRAPRTGLPHPVDL